MGLDAQVIAIGKFHKEIADFLEYPSEMYKDTRDGAVTFVTVFQSVTTSQSCELAAYFGIHPWDFNNHVLDPSKVDIIQLKNSDFFDRVETFLVLRDNDFTFYYLPNG